MLKHEFSAGFPYPILESSHYVPGSDRLDVPRYAGKAIWKAIMLVSEAATVEYAHRVIRDFDKKVTAESAKKMKDPA